VYRLLAQQGPQQNDAGLMSVAEHTDEIAGIEELVLGGSAVTDQGAAVLPKFTGLKRLHLSGSRVTGKSLEYAAALPALEVLGFNGIPLEDANLQALEPKQSLTELLLAGTSIGDGAIERIAALEHLQVLDVTGNDQVLGRTFSELVKQRRFRELRSLKADNSGFGYYGLLELSTLPHLEHLGVGNSFVSDEALEGLRSCTSLKTLYLNTNKITSAGLSHLKRLTNLEELRLGGNPAIGDDGLKELRGLKQLKDLSLDGTGCTPAGVRELKERHLKSTLIRFGGQQL
jgi:Leucine-rich repeat (LRR) protein